MKPKPSQFLFSYSQGNGRPIERLDGQHFRLDLRPITDVFGRELPPRLVDLLRIAMSVYVADRLCKRPRQGEFAGWSRSIRLGLEVLDTAFWNELEVQDLLTRCIEFVSGDRWDFEFQSGQVNTRSRVVSRPMFPVTGDVVCLYSGGLDSAAGLVQRIRDQPGRKFLTVTVAHQARQRRAVFNQFMAIRRHVGVPLVSLIVPATMKRPVRQEEENSQRCRSFLFACVGGVVAALNSVTEVEVYESGVGAVNLPMYDWMVGSRATKSSHPFFLRLASRVVSLAAVQEVTFRLPFLDRTKAEVVGGLAGAAALENLARATVSCVHYPLREKRHKQCGYCPACLFRRQALAIAGIAEQPDSYKYDLFDPGALREMERKQLRYLVAFLLQADKLHELDLPGGPPSFFLQHLRATELLTSRAVLDAYITLYRRYGDEWLDLAARHRHLGRPWSVLADQEASPR